jgi:hypothetical protein
MVDYFDNNNEMIKEGFYIQKELNALFYFTGKYDIEDFPIFEVEGDYKRRYSLSENLIKQLSKLDKKDIFEKLEESQEIKTWINKKFKA